LIDAAAAIGAQCSRDDVDRCAFIGDANRLLAVTIDYVGG